MLSGRHTAWHHAPSAWWNLICIPVLRGTITHTDMDIARSTGLFFFFFAAVAIILPYIILADNI